MKILFRKVLLVGLIMSLTSIVVNAQKKGDYALRLNFDGDYTYTPGYSALLPCSSGIDIGWVMHKNLTLFAGMAYWQADHSEFWQDANYDYYWESPMVSILINGSAKFTTPTLKLNRRDKLGAFFEPGISIEPIPMAVVNYEKIYPFSYYSDPIWDVKTKFAAPYFSWNMKFGLSYIMEDLVFFDLAYTVSSMDMYKVYRGMTIDGQPLDDFCPKATLINGLRFTLGVYLK